MKTFLRPFLSALLIVGVPVIGFAADQGSSATSVFEPECSIALSNTKVSESPSILLGIETFKDQANISSMDVTFSGGTFDFSGIRPGEKVARADVYIADMAKVSVAKAAVEVYESQPYDRGEAAQVAVFELVVTECPPEVVEYLGYDPTGTVLWKIEHTAYGEGQGGSISAHNAESGLPFTKGANPSDALLSMLVGSGSYRNPDTAGILGITITLASDEAKASRMTQDSVIITD